MNHHSLLRKKMLCGFLSSLLLVSCGQNSQSQSVTNLYIDSISHHPQILPGTVAIGKKKIKIALLLDTSNSMDGLIDQAKAQLWKIVNELALAKCDDQKPDLEIAVYEYGNNGLSSTNGYIRQVTPFTHDLDLISEKLFSLRTNGGEEYCGYVISSATKELIWSDNKKDLQLVFIAGNESFNQGPVDGKEACLHAKEKGITVNTIFCGNYDQGVSLGWKSAAIFANGDYMCIEQDRKTVYITTPYDDRIGLLNDRLNETYVTYGANGHVNKANQIAQDKNAAGYGISYYATRAVSKSSKMYSNSSWDLVDAAEKKEFDISKVSDDELPDTLKGKTKEEKLKYIEEKTKERQAVIKEIGELNAKRVAFIAEKEKSMKPEEKSLDAAMIRAIREQATEKNFVFEAVK